MQYYEEFKRVDFYTVENVALVSQLELRGVRIPGVLHIICNIPYSDENGMEKLYFTTFDGLDGYFLIRSPKKVVRLFLSGKSKPENKDVYAIVEVDVKFQDCQSAIFSPVPFGVDGIPKLPYQGEDLAMFLRVVRALVLYPLKFINGEQLRQEMIPILLTAPRHYDFWEVTAAHWLSETDKLGITCDRGDKGHEVLMLPQQFEEIFGVKLSTI